MLRFIREFARALLHGPGPRRDPIAETRTAAARDREQGFTEQHGWYGPTYSPVHQPVHRPQRPSLP